MKAPVPTAPQGVEVSPISHSVSAELARGTNMSIVTLLECIITQAHSLNASDIHLDPTREGVRVRLRLDGVLKDFDPLPKSVHQEVISRIKVLASLRTDEHQAAQDGRFRHTFADGSCIDMRVSIAPTYHGENAVLRLLSGHSGDYSLSMLGFSDGDREKIERAIYKSNGMILSTGPTGSGKTRHSTRSSKCSTALKYQSLPLRILLNTLLMVSSKSK